MRQLMKLNFLKYYYLKRQYFFIPDLSFFRVKPPTEVAGLLYISVSIIPNKKGRYLSRTEVTYLNDRINI